MNNNLKKVRLSVLDLAVISEGFGPAQAFKNSLSLAQKAETLGYHRFWLAEHHNMASIASSATSVLIGHVAGGTQSIRVGSGGIMLPNHSPLMVAEQFGTLASLYPNRIDLGLGRAPGTDPKTARALQRDEQAAYKFPENVRALQQYFSEENKDSDVRAIPGEGLDVPIWILGSSTDSARLASSFGLPYAFASHFAPQQLHQALQIYHRDFQSSQYLKSPNTIACVNVIAADTTQEAHLIASSMKKVFMGILTKSRKPLQPPDPSFVLPPDFEQALSPFLKYSFIGNPDEIEAQVNQFISETHVDEIMVVSHIYDHEARLHSYEILKELQMKA